MDAAIFHCVRRQIELAEDAAHVRFDRLGRDVEPLADPTIRSPFRKEREDLELARRQLSKRVAVGGRREKVRAQLAAPGIAPPLQA
jgi:hypothetical protein